MTRPRALYPAVEIVVSLVERSHVFTLQPDGYTMTITSSDGLEVIAHSSERIGIDQVVTRVLSLINVKFSFDGPARDMPTYQPRNFSGSTDGVSKMAEKKGKAGRKPATSSNDATANTGAETADGAVMFNSLRFSKEQAAWLKSRKTDYGAVPVVNVLRKLVDDAMLRESSAALGPTAGTL
jgi:hypothetical protein